MRWWVVVPGALLPAPIAAELPADACPPPLAALLRRAAAAALQPVALPFDGAAHLGFLWQAFGGRGMPVSAPFVWRAVAGGAAQGSRDERTLPGALWQADPVHFALARDHMLVTPAVELHADEAAALCAEAAPILASAGARLLLEGGHWFIAFDDAWALQATPLDAALGESAQERLPQGPDAARWRKLLTEVQIAWHHSAVNEARAERGAPAVNGLWLHGGGDAPVLPRARFAHAASAAPATRGWALAAGVAADAVSDERDPLPAAGAAPMAAGVRGDVLLEWRALLEPYQRNDWGAWLAQWQRLARQLAEVVGAAASAGADVDLVLCGRAHVRQIAIARGDRWKLWRSQSLQPLLVEPVEAA